MHRWLIIILLCTAAANVLQVPVSAEGTPLLLGGGQELRFDLPLEAEQRYRIRVDFRTNTADAVLNVSLWAVGGGGETVEYQSEKFPLAEGEAWQEIAVDTGQIPRGPLRWELVFTSNREGRYWWRGLSAIRSPEAKQTAQEYWSHKLASEGTFYTGLIVDARHLDVRRGLSPRIYSESGQLIYGGVFASQELVQERGIVGYGSELTPELLKRLELDPDYPYLAPLAVKAVGTADSTKTGVYITEADTALILEAMVKYDFFARYAVIFLVK